jgi:serine/threonine protein phosphatase 1
MVRLFRSRKIAEKPRLPEGLRIYAFGDIHGRADLLSDLLGVIDQDMARSPPLRAIEVFLGDYIDRGPASREVLDILIRRRSLRETVFLRGNHEAFLLEMLEGSPRFVDWRRFGLTETLRSYGLRPSLSPTAEEQMTLRRELSQCMPEEHLALLRTLPLSFACGDFFFVHAGIRPGIPLNEQAEEDLLWIRRDFLESNRNFGKYIVHGHSPVLQPDIRPNRINIDTGAYATGNLTLLTIEGSSLLAL